MKIKIEISEASKFLDDMLSQLDGISQTMRFGDDGFEDSVNSQIKDIKQYIKSFRALNLVVADINSYQRHY